MSSHGISKPQPTMNESLLSRIRAVRDLKAGPPEYHVESVSPREEPVEFHFDLLGQQYTLRFERTGDTVVGPWGEHELSRDVYVGPDADAAHLLNGTTLNSSNAPRADVIGGVRRAMTNVRNELKPTYTTSAPCSLMAYNGSFDDAAEAVPHGDDGGTGIETISFDFLGLRFDLGYDVLEGPDSRDRNESVVYVSHDLESVGHTSDEFPTLDGQGPYYYFTNTDNVVKTVGETVNRMHSDMRDISAGLLETFDTYE